MNNIFNLKRFGLAFRKDILESWKRYTLLFLTMLGIIAIVITIYSFNQYLDIERYDRDMKLEEQIKLNKDLLAQSSLMFAAFGLLFASTFANPMNSKLKKISFLVSPSSNFEKYLTRWVITVTGYIIAFFVALWIADLIRVIICSARYPDLNVSFIDFTKLIYQNNDWSFGMENVFNKQLFMICTSIFFLFQSLFVLGSTFWEKSSFIKTFTACALIVLSFVLICRWTILLFYGGFDEFGNVMNSFESIEKNDENGDRALMIVSCVISVFTLTNWVIAFFRFRESEITKRI